MITDTFTIISQEELSPGIFQMVLYAPQMAQKALPGQFVDIYCSSKDKLLPRPISLFDADPVEGTLSLIYAVVGKGTEEISSMAEGDTIRVTGPLGHGFPLEQACRMEEIFLVGGGLGIPPMYLLARRLHTLYPEKPIRVFLGFRSEPWIGEIFSAFGKVLPSSDDGACGFKGTVIDRMKNYLDTADAGSRILYACGPIPMMRAIQPFASEHGIETWFSLEERMGCGFGACYGCPARLRTEDGGSVLKRVCKDGPVFPGKDVIFA